MPSFSNAVREGSMAQAALSSREKEVLRDVYEGLSRAEIASSHELSVNAVKLMVNSIHEKLSARNTADVIRIAVERGLV